MLKLMLPLGLVVFGAVAAFMGAVVLGTSLSRGEITIGVAASAGQPSAMRTVSRATDPAGYWRTVLMLGALPAFGGLAAAAYGWRRLSR